MKDKFIKFLKEQGIYDKFMEAFEKDADYKDIDDLIKETDYEYLIVSAFIWEDTENGFDFWGHIDNKWWRIVNE